MIILEMIRKIYWRFLMSPERYDRHLGVKIGEKCLISTRRWPSEPYLITIGNHVQVTENVWFYTHGGGNIVRKQIPDFDCFGKIVVEDWAYIGSGSKILPGVIIGEGALVAAGSVVTKSVPAYTVVGGNPAKVICSIEEYICRNQKYNVRTYGLSYEEKKKKLLSISDEYFIKK